MHKRLEAGNVTLLASTTYRSDPEPQIDQMKDSGARIMLSFVELQYSIGWKRPLCLVNILKLFLTDYTVA